ncbi:MAG: hypothetical protein ACRD07_07715 [Acidimicrobiales bacterium]
MIGADLLAAARFWAAGHELTDATEAELAARRVGRMAHTLTPWGVRIELVHDLENASTPFASELMPGGFHTRGVGFGHAVFATTAFDESHEFLVGGLGFA